MSLSKHRFEFFSDGIMAIIITIMVLEIPLPTNFGYHDIISFLYSIFIFIVSFFIVGSFWNKHHWLIDQIDEITNKVVWRNMIFLLSLALLPIFTKWVLENPTQLVPVLFYDILFIIVNITFIIIGKEVHDQSFSQRRREKKAHENIFHVFVMVILLVPIIILGIFCPEVTILLFMGFPILSSILNIFIDDRRANLERQ